MKSNQEGLGGKTALENSSSRTYFGHCLLTLSWSYPVRLWPGFLLSQLALTISTNYEHLSLVFYSLHRYVSAQTWTRMDGSYLGGSQGWFGSILSVDSPPHWATVCSLKAEPTSMLCSSRPLLLKGLASLQPPIASCPIPSRGPHKTLE